MDELERQIRERRDELDRVEPFAADWIWNATHERIGARRAGGKRRRLYLGYAAAAAAVVISVAVFLTGGAGAEWEEPVPRSLADLSPELGARERQLRADVRDRERSVGLDRLDRRDYAPYFREFALLDSLRTEFLTDLPVYGEDERLVSSLLRLYELELELLRQLERELKQRKQYDLPIPTREI